MNIKNITKKYDIKIPKKHVNMNQRGSSGSIPSIEISKECLESGDYVSDESEYQEGGNGDRSHHQNTNSNTGPPSPSTSHSQYQSAQHQYHQVRWIVKTERKSIQHTFLLFSLSLFLSFSLSYVSVARY